MSGIEGNNTSICVVCYKNVEIYSIGKCEHPVCYECSTRMRVLCQQNECPICRQCLPEVVFTKEIKPFTNSMKKGLFRSFSYNIYYENKYIYKKFCELLAENCNLCDEEVSFETFHELTNHMRDRHLLYYCELCAENLKIFPRERRWYTRRQLLTHLRKGDVDDRSHRGHPLCEFCNLRYMDNDELYRHLRRDHLYCHFCDEDGLHQYYDSYDYLRDHFRLEHYLCEEGECAEEKFTSVFRTDIDLKAHRSSAHSKQLSKAAAKQARTLELEFTLAPRGRMRRVPFQYRRDRDFTDARDNNVQAYMNTSNFSNFQNAQGSQHSPNFQNPQNSQSFSSYQSSNNGQNFQQFARPSTSRDECPCYLEPTFMQPQVDVQSTEEFPTLGGGAGVSVPTSNTAQKGRGNVTILSTLRNQELAVTDENFPALGPESSISKTVNVSLSGNSGGNMGNGTSNVSIQVNHEGNGTVMRVSGPNIRIRPSLKIDSEFPALGGGEAAATGGNGSGANNGSAPWKEVLQWTCSKTNSKMAVGTKKKNNATAPSHQPTPHGEDFPSLSKSKKQSTLTMVPTWGPQAQNSNSHQQNVQGTSNNGMTKGKTKKKKDKRAGGGGTGGGADGGSRKDAKENECAENFESLGRLGNTASSRSGAENAESFDYFCNSPNSRSLENFDYFSNSATTGNAGSFDYFNNTVNPRNSDNHGSSGNSKNTGKAGNSSSHKSADNYDSLDNVGHSKSGANPRSADNLENFDYFNNTAKSGNSGNSRNSIKSGNSKNSENSENALNFGNARANSKTASSSNSLNSQSSLIAQKGSNSQREEQALKKDKRKQRIENKGNNCCTSLNVTNNSQNSSNTHNSKNFQNLSDSNDSNSDSNLNSKSTTNLTLNPNSKATGKSSSNCNSASKSPTKSSSNVNVNASTKVAAKSSPSSTNQGTSKSQRKRTELKIDSLNANSSNSSSQTNSKNSNNSSNNSISYTDYPPLSSTTSKPSGFTHPPPGFTNPPPGFSVKYNLDNNLTFTNSSGETYSILPDRPCDLEKRFTTHDAKNYLYTPPADFQERNKRLVAKLNDVLLEQDNVEEFRRISGSFRQGSCTPGEYYKHCRRVIGRDAFRDIFPELLLLLPDIKQQQELFRVYRSENGGGTSLEECPSCRQVLRPGKELKAHFDSHEI